MDWANFATFKDDGGIKPEHQVGAGSLGANPFGFPSLSTNRWNTLLKMFEYLAFEHRQDVW